MMLVAVCRENVLDGSNDDDASTALGGSSSSSSLWPVNSLAAVGSKVVEEGTAAVNELTLGTPYDGDAAPPDTLAPPTTGAYGAISATGGSRFAYEPLWLVNQEFSVRMPGTEVQRILVGDALRTSEGWHNGNPTFVLEFEKK